MEELRAGVGDRFGARQTQLTQTGLLPDRPDDDDGKAKEKLDVDGKEKPDWGCRSCINFDIITFFYRSN
jgi:hypothetical protein